MRVYVVLGRFGDIYMACKRIKKGGILVVSKEFKSIVTELFPNISVFTIDKKITGISEALELAKLRFPSAKIACCQQNGIPFEAQKEFRNYQSYQEFQADAI
jgi:hypothetical protein